MARRRGALQIMADILSATRAPTNKSGIMRKANLNAKRAGRYISYLVEKGFLSISDERGRTLYRATEKGLSWLREYEELAAEYERVVAKKEELERALG